MKSGLSRFTRKELYMLYEATEFCKDTLFEELFTNLTIAHRVYHKFIFEKEETVSMGETKFLVPNYHTKLTEWYEDNCKRLGIGCHYSEIGKYINDEFYKKICGVE